jgi:hypothetical protein
MLGARHTERHSSLNEFTRTLPKRGIVLHGGKSALYQYLYYFLVTVSPILLGSNRPIFWALNAILGALILSSLLLLERHAILRSRFSWALPLLAMTTLCGIALWSVIQAAPFVPELAKHPVWSAVARTNLVPQAASIGINPSAAWSSIAFVSVLAATLLATVRIGNSTPRSIFALAYLVGVSTAVALFGIVVVRFDLETVGLVEKSFYRDWVTGTFVNRNAAATYFATTMLIALSLGFCFLIGVGRGRKFGLACFSFFAAAFLFAALLMTGSRGGLAAGLMGALIVLALAHRVHVLEVIGNTRATGRNCACFDRLHAAGSRG